MQTKDTPDKGETGEACCGHAAPAGGVGAVGAVALFQQFVGQCAQPGALDAVTKELIAVALGLAVNCVACSRIHIRKALSMGVGAEELEEAAALAMAFGGCRAMMLWHDMQQELL